MTKGNAAELIVRFALPLIVGNIFQQLYTVTDAAIVGKGVGIGALAAVGAVDWVVWLFFGLLQGATQGFSVIISQVFGAGDYKRLRNMRAMAELISIILTVVIVGSGLILQSQIVGLLNIPDEVLSDAKLYLTIITAGLPCYVFYNIYASFLRAVGNSKVPFVAIVVASLTNIALDSVAVFVLKLGVMGAAAATVFSQFMSGLVCFITVCRTDVFKYRMRDIKLDIEDAKNLLKVGMPIGFQNFVIAVGGVVLTAVVNNFGTVFIAGFTAGNKFYGVLEIAALSFGLAVTTYVGQNFGAGEKERVREGLKSAIKMAIIVAAVLGIAAVVFSKSIAGLFISSEDPVLSAQALEIGAFYLTLMGSFLPVLYMIYITRFALQGLGEAMPSVYSAGAELVARVVVALIAAALVIPRLTIWGEIIAWIVGFLVSLYSYVKRMRKMFPAVKNETVPGGEK